MVMLKLVEVLLLNFSLIRVTPVLPAVVGTFNITQPSGLCGCLQVWSLLLMACFIRDRQGKAEMHSSDLQAEDGNVSVCRLKYPGLFGL